MRIAVLILFLVHSLDLKAQLRGNNLNELQLGNIPGAEPSDLITNYNRLNLLYSYKNINTSLRYEHFIHPELEKEYHQITQYNLNYRNKGIELQLGHFNETLGNGILLRSYEIPGSVFEDQAYRIRQGFYRDLRGFSAAYDHKYFNIKLLRARSLLNLLPPTLESSDRRPDLSEAIQVGGRLFRQNIGIIFMRNHNSGVREDYGSVFMKGFVLNAISWNLELARQLSDPSLFSIDENSSYGIYGSLNYSLGNLGLSLEYKNYQNIFIGSGISDPPTLIREQSYRVLNRSIHVPELSDESGIQTELYYSFSNGKLLTFNYARTKNELFRDFIFQEFFIEYETGFREYDVFRVFLDYSQDPLRLEDHRYSLGFLLETLGNNNWGTIVQAEYQYFDRQVSDIQTVHNSVLIASVYVPSLWTLGLNFEFSTDPVQTALIPEAAEREYRLWPGISGSWQVNSENKLTFFAGKRRGGPACTSGICYEVLDFEGIEIRLSTKF
jgi:hypothetical protein